MAKSTNSQGAVAKDAPADRSVAKTGAYTVLARRYRSRDFDELVGQEPIARTLQNAIRTGRTAHAYLFSGTRGVGKTSMARIFAKALNATDDLREKDAVADAILRGDDLDVIEIDGASYRGVNEARELIAGAGLSPARSPYKIYIIDEVHQLTKDAFNALLKTMEEPPAHVKFILCTTEPHKVPATIQSRCQRFDFRAIPTARIAQQLREILRQEGMTAEEEVIAQVARLGNGSMRDALSIMDRLLAAGENVMTVALLEEMLGLPDHTIIVELIEAISRNDPAAALDRGAQLLARGATIEQALEMLTEHLRNMMVAIACGGVSELLDLSEESRATVVSQAAKFDAQGLVYMIALCDAAARHARASAAERAIFDATLVRLSLSQHFADIPALLSGTAVAPAAAPQPAPGRAAGASVERKPLPPSAESKKKAPSLDDVSSRESASPTPGDASQLLPEPKSAVDQHSIGRQLWQAALQAAAGSIGDRTRTEFLSYESFDGRRMRLAIDRRGVQVAAVLKNETDRLADLVRRATGYTVEIELDASALQADVPPDSRADDVAAARRLPAVAKAMDLFGAEVVAVESSDAGPRVGRPATLGSDYV